jgi:hypothetical protein
VGNFPNAPRAANTIFGRLSLPRLRKSLSCHTQKMVAALRIASTQDYQLSDIEFEQKSRGLAILTTNDGGLAPGPILDMVPHPR